MPRALPLLFLFLLLFRTADAAEVYGAGYLCDEVNNIFKLANTQRIGDTNYDQSYPASLTTPLVAGLNKVSCSLGATSISAAIAVTLPSERRVCGGAPSITLQDVSINGRPVITQAVMDSHCRAGFALLGLSVSLEHPQSQPQAPQIYIETVWSGNGPTSRILYEGKLWPAVDAGPRHLAPWDPDFGKPDSGISRQQIAKLRGSLNKACTAVLSLKDAHDAAKLEPTKLVEAALSRMDLHVERITASIEKSPAHAVIFVGQDDTTLSWHGDLLSEPISAATNGTWLYVPKAEFIGWDSVLFRIYFNEQAAFSLNYRVWVADRSITPNGAVCPKLNARTGK